MKIEYQTYLPRILEVGHDINIEGVKWYCVKECVLIGSTIPDNDPVLRNLENEPVLNDDQLVMSNQFKTPPKCGQSFTENMVLGEYLKIKPEDLVRKNIKYVRYTEGTFIAVCNDKTYVKLSALTFEYGDYIELCTEDITFHDLRSMGIIDDITWDTNKDERQITRMARNQEVAESNFRQAVGRIGLERAKELLP